MNPPMTILQAVSLGFIEGLTEFIPVSSTGHLVVFSKLLGVEQTEFLKTFQIFIQTGAILAVLPLFIRKVKLNPVTLVTVGAAFVPTALAGIFLYPVVRKSLENQLLVSATLIIGGIIIILVERFLHSRNQTNAPTGQVSLKEGFFLGCFQCFALIPGTSRSGATIIGGLLRGLHRVDIVEFSFLLSVPTIMGAGAYDLLRTPIHFNPQEILLLTVGFLSAWGAAVLCIKAFLRYISHHSFEAFGWYRIIAGVIFSFIFLM